MIPITAFDGSLPAVTSDTYILTTPTVMDLDDFVARPDRYLQSIKQDPETAADLWRRRLKNGPVGSEGRISLQHFGVELLDPAMWDDVNVMWHQLLCLVRDFARDGEAAQVISVGPEPTRLRRQRNTVLFATPTSTFIVQPDTFLAGVVDEAEFFFDWQEEYLGIAFPGDRSTMREARALLRG